MYQPTIEAMPWELKDALLGIGDFETLDDIMSLEEKNSSEPFITQVKNALSDVELPDFWIVTLNIDDPTYDLFYVLFETKLTKDQEEKFFSALPADLRKKFGEESLKDEFGIY